MPPGTEVVEAIRGWLLSFWYQRPVRAARCSRGTASRTAVRMQIKKRKQLGFCGDFVGSALARRGPAAMARGNRAPQTLFSSFHPCHQLPSDLPYASCSLADSQTRVAARRRLRLGPSPPLVGAARAGCFGPATKAATTEIGAPEGKAQRGDIKAAGLRYPLSRGKSPLTPNSLSANVRAT